MKRGVKKSPVFLLKTGLFILKAMKRLISNVMENWRLRISASISLGIHLFLILTATFLFSSAEIHRTPICNVKVILYPLEKEQIFIPKFVPPLSVKNQIQRPEKRGPFQEEKQREPVLKEEFKPPIPLPVQVTVRDIPFEEAKLIFSPQEEEKTVKEPTDEEMEIASDRVSDLNKEENLSVSSLSGTLKGDKLSNATSGEWVGTGQGGSPGGDPENGLGAGREGFHLKVSEGGGRGLGQGVYSGEGLARGSGNGLGLGSARGSEERVSSGGGSRRELGSGTGSGQGDSRGGGSRKGAGIIGRLFSSSGGTGGGYARYAENPKPPYPEEGRKEGMEGEVLLRVEVLASGRVGQIEVRRSSGHEILDESALSTVRQWKFIPASRGDELIASWVNIPIKFQLR